MITQLNDRIAAALTKNNLPLEGWNSMSEIWKALKSSAKAEKTVTATAKTLVDKGATVEDVKEESKKLTEEIKANTEANKASQRDNKKLDRKIKNKKEWLKAITAKTKEEIATLQELQKKNRENVKERNITNNLLRVKKTRATAVAKERSKIVSDLLD